MNSIVVTSLRLFSVVILAAVSGAGRAAAALPLQANVARVELTPPRELKAALGGYGARLSKPAVGAHDGVWAKALALQRGSRKFVLVTADVLAFPPKFKSNVLERLAPEGWSAEQVLLLPSHTHTSIDMMALHPDNVFGIPQVGVFHKALFDHTANCIARAVREARQNLVPALADSRTVSLPDRNRNRRAGNSACDRELTVTRIDTTDKRPLAVLVNWTAHPTFMDEEDMLFSGDWPGHLQRTLEALIGQGVTVLFHNGAEGDQSPTPPTGTASNWERAERYGRELAVEAWRLWEKAQPSEVLVFAFRTERLTLPKRQWHPDFMKTGGAEYGLNEAMMREFVERLVPAETLSTTLRLGDLLITGVPGEMAAQLGMEIKAQARQVTGARCAAIGGLADEWISYILSAEEYRKGGYEASVSFYGESLGSTVVEGVLRGVRAAK
jgi:hypothetical protein